MYKFKMFILCLFLITACSSSNDTNMHMSVLGRWRGEFPQKADSSADRAKYDVEFLPLNILLVDIARPEESVHGLRFSYKFITDDRIRIEGRIVDEIQVNTDRQNLRIVNSDHGLPPRGRYKRVFSRLEVLLVIIIFILAVIFLAIFKRIKEYISKTNQQSM